MRMNWTPDDDAKLRSALAVPSYYRDGKLASIAADLGRSIDSVKGRAKHLGIPRNESRLIIRQDLTIHDLGDDVRQVLIGSILGDGSLRYQNGRTHFREEHEAKQRNYVVWKADVLRPLHGQFYDGTKPTVRTPSAPMFSDLKEQFYGSTSGMKNRIPQGLIRDLGALGLLIWYLDDGSVQWHKITMRIGSKCFSRDDLEATCDTLNLELGTDLAVTSSRHRGGQYHCITIREASRKVLLPLWLADAERLGLPDCMMYKIRPTPPLASVPPAKW